MDLGKAPGFKRRPAASSSFPRRAGEAARSTPPHSPSSSVSSPSSGPSSPLSTSSSLCPNAAGCQKHVNSQNKRVEVSSTSATLNTQANTTPTSNTPPSDHYPHTSMQPSTDYEEDDRKRDMYDPFNPTDGERDGQRKEEEEEEEEEEGVEGEKYDPFDPTGSPASDVDDECNTVEVSMKNASREDDDDDDDEKEEEPPDSTDTLTEAPATCLPSQLPLRRRVDCSSTKAGGKRENDSDHSEIEEGEIVGAADRDLNKKRAGEEVLSLNSPSVTFFGSKPERILRVLDGDGFVSVCTEGSWEVDRELEDEPVVGVKDLRRKLVSRRKERYLSFPASSPLSPQPPPPPPPHPPVSTSSSPLTPAVEQGSKSHKSSKSSKERDQQKSKERKAGDKEARRKKRRKDKEGLQEKNKEKERSHKAAKDTKERRSSRSSSRKRKKRRHSSPEASRSCNSSGRGAQTRQSFSSLSEERRRERDRETDRERERETDRERERETDRERDRETDRERERERDRETDRERDRETDRERDRETDRERERETDRERDRETDRERERERDRETDRERERERDRETDRERERERDRDKDRDRRRGRERDKDREKDQSCTNSHRRDDRDRDSSSRKRERERRGRLRSGSREQGPPKRSKRSGEKRNGNRERDRRRDGRPVVPPSIQDLNGSDLFAIKRTITVTTTTTTTTMPGSPRLTPSSPCRPTQDSDKPHKRKKKRKWHSAGEEEEEERRSCHSRSQSHSPSRYHNYESDRYSDKLEIDVLSLDGEALDSDYPSLEDTPPAVLPPVPAVPSPKSKAASKTGQHHPKKKSRALKKIGPSESSSSSNRTKGKCLSSLTVTSGSSTVSPGHQSTKRTRKMGKEKERNKGSRKEVNRTGKSKKVSGGGRKGKLQSKVSVLVREGVSSTTGASVSSGKLGMDLLGPGGTGAGAGASVVGGSIAVVFCRDNESRSPFLKPCSEPLSLGGRNKDVAAMGKRSSLAAPPSSLSSTAGLKSKKAKPSSITSTSSSASSPSSSLPTKHRRRMVKKTREKGGATGLTAGDNSQSKTASEGWTGASIDVQLGVGDGGKSVSPHTGQLGPAPCPSSSSSTSSSTSVLPPSSSPPHTPPPSTTPLRDTRESSPDSQTVDSSCKTPDPSFLAEDCPTQTSPTLPTSSPPSLSTPQGAGLSNALSTPTAKPLPPDDAPKSLASPPCTSSSALSLPLSSSDPSSSSSVSSSSAAKPLPPPPLPAAPALPWSLQTGVDCTTGGVLALTALLFKMEEANIASRAKAQEFIQATSQILSQANQSQSQQLAPPSSSSSSSSSQIPPPSSVPPPPRMSPAQFILHGSLPPSHLHATIGGGCAQTPPPIVPVGLSGLSGSSGDSGWDTESKDPDKYLKKLHTQERAVEEVKLAIKPYYQRKDINKDEYKDILRKAVHKICHSRTGEINPVKVSNLVKLYVQRYKYFRKHGRKMDEEEREDRESGALHSSS